MTLQYERAVLARVTQGKDYFTLGDLRAVLNASYKTANLLLCKWLERGWIDLYGLVRRGRTSVKAFVATQKAELYA